VLLRRAAAVTGGLLALFHLWLLGSQVWQGQLADPGLLLRWLIAVGVVAALVHLGRSGQPLFFGRKGIAVWLLAALLHGPTTATDVATHPSPALPEAVTALVQIAAASVVLGLGLLVVAAWRTRQSGPRVATRLAAAVRVHLPPGGRFVVPRASRPPPGLRLLVASPV
jgi:hypothetical protein